MDNLSAFPLDILVKLKNEEQREKENMDNHKNTAQLKQLCYNEKTRNERFFFQTGLY